jgi:hypothetical protein
MLLGRPVTDDVRRRLAGDSGIFTGTAPQRIAPFPGLELGRVHLPVRDTNGELVGHLWAIDGAGAVPESDWLRLQHAAGAALPAVLADVGAAGRTRGAPLDRLVASHRSFRVFAIDIRTASIVDPEGLVGFSPLDRVLQQLRTRPHGLHWSVMRDSAGREVLVAGGAPEALGRAGIEQVVVDAVQAVNVDAHAIGRVTVFASPALFTSHEVFDHLEAVHSIAGATAAEDVDVVFADDLPSYELLVELGRIAPIRRLEVPRALRTLLETDRGLTIARTAKAFLDAGGNAGRTATELGVHRGTLYYRIARIEEQTGFDLERGDHRVALHLGLTAAQIEGLI